MNQLKPKIFFLLVTAFLAMVSSCAPDNQRAKKPVDKSGEQPRTNPGDINYYAEEEKPERQFDTSTGAVKSDMTSVDISKTPFKLGHVHTGNEKIELRVENTLLPEKLSSFYIDGNHAVAISGKSTIDDLEMADSVLTITGSVTARSVILGISVFRSVIAKHKSVDDLKPALLIIDGPGNNDSSHFKQLGLWGESFLDVRTTLQLGDHEEGSYLMTDGITVDGVENDLSWRMQGAELDVDNSTIRASKIAITEHARLRLKAANLIQTKGDDVMLDLHDRSTTLLMGKNTLSGPLNTKKNSYILINGGSDMKGTISVGSLTVKGIAVIQGKIALSHSFWTPGNEAESLARYQELFKTNNEFIIIKADKLFGRARLVSQEQARKDLNDSSGWIGYLEKHVLSSGKKLALQHDYTNNVIMLKIVDKSEAVDDDGCLKDIGKS